MNKKLTIGIGTYGKKRNYIGRTLKSIIALLKKYRYTNKTIITVYNDDKQYSLDYITALKFQEKYPNLIVCKDNQQNLGIAKTYQKMCLQCQTPYFLQFDSDDIIGDFDIKQQIQFLDNNKKYCGSYGIKIIFDENGKKIGFFGDQYSLVNNNITINNNSLLIRVEDFKTTNGYFPEFYTNDKPFDAALDVVMWIGLVLKKPLYFDRVVRAYGLDWEDGNHIKHGDKYNEQFAQMQSMLRKKYGMFSNHWTVYEKQLYYFLWNNYLNKQQKKQFWDLVGQQKFQDNQFFRTYCDFLYQNKQYQKLYANLFLGLLKNKQLEICISAILATSGLVKFYQDKYSQFFTKKIKQLTPKQTVGWFERFIKIKAK